MRRGKRIFLALLLAPALAGAVEVGIKVEPGVALPLGDPQARRFGVGGGGEIKAALGVARFLDLQLAGAVIGLPSYPASGSSEPGMAYAVGGGARLLRPHGSGIVSPWIDADLLYVRSGALDRFGFAAGVGVNFGIGKSRLFWLGPYVRYMHIVQTAQRLGFDNTDAKTLFAGLSLEVGTSRLSSSGGPADKDGDGIPDDKDQCPEQAEDKDGFQDADGCPEPDNDKDGILDGADRCPNQAEDKDKHEDEDGCPELDNDGDGINDTLDQCPDQAEDRDGFGDDDGCPELDNDQDGLLDVDDKCPNLAGPKETEGCPDRDRDKVTDPEDHCPDVAGTPENHGCPLYKSVTVKDNRLELAQKIFFAHDTTKILPRSFPLLDEVATVLKDSPKLRVRIEGHTDAAGKDERNLALSDGRAKAVEAYLQQKGVVAARLVAKGYGSSLPIDTNKTLAGREHNRRVEFVIMGEGDK